MSVPADAPAADHQALPSVVPALLVTVVALALILVPMLSGQPSPGATPPPGRNLAFHDPESRAEVVVSRLDGVFFAEMALDPSYQQLEANIDGGATHATYRASRPVTGWLAWIGSLGGQRSLVAPALIAITALSMGLAAYSLSCLAAPTGARRGVVLALLVMPGMFVSLIAPGLCDQLAAALGIAALAALERGHRRAALALLVLAVLSRETLLLLAVGIALADGLTERRWRAASLVAVPLAAYAGWITVVHQMLGAWPFGNGGEQLSVPAAGLLSAVPLWTSMEVVTILATATAVVAAVASGRPRVLGVVVVHLVFALLLGEIVWKLWSGFGRVLVPVQILGLAYFMSAEASAQPGPGHALHGASSHDGVMNPTGQVT